MAEQKREDEFHVTDRRRFTTSGEPLKHEQQARAPEAARPPEPAAGAASGAGSPPPPPPAPATPPPAAQPASSAADAPAGVASSPGAAAPEARKGGPRPSTAAEQAASTYAAAGIGLQKVSFDRIILSYAQTAMLQLGLLAADPSQPLEPDLYGARETIDALALLQDKTRGNLSPDEHRLMENTLFELRMAWMEMDRRFTTARGTTPKS